MRAVERDPLLSLGRRKNAGWFSAALMLCIWDQERRNSICHTFGVLRSVITLGVYPILSSRQKKLMVCLLKWGPILSWTGRTMNFGSSTVYVVGGATWILDVSWEQRVDPYLRVSRTVRCLWFRRQNTAALMHRFLRAGTAVSFVASWALPPRIFWRAICITASLRRALLKQSKLLLLENLVPFFMFLSCLVCLTVPALAGRWMQGFVFRVAAACVLRSSVA